MEGPYRDLGAGFARLTGVEGARRGRSGISHVEDALVEMLRNARDAGARNVLVASTLTRRRFRTLTVIDDGSGIPDAYASLIFEPGVTTRHLNPTRDPVPHGSGLALYHIREAALSAELLSTASPTALRATFDTDLLPERALQSRTRPSTSNLRASMETFLRRLPPDRHLSAYYGSPARVLATLHHNHIIQGAGDAVALKEVSDRLGLGVSLRTAQRVLRGEVGALGPVAIERGERGVPRGRRVVGEGGPVLPLGDGERAGIEAILRRAASAGYLEVENLRVESRPGEIVVRAHIYEPEDEYD